MMQNNVSYCNVQRTFRNFQVIGSPVIIRVIHSEVEQLVLIHCRMILLKFIQLRCRINNICYRILVKWMIKINPSN